MENGGFVIETLFVFEHGQAVFMDIVDYITKLTAAIVNRKPLTVRRFKSGTFGFAVCFMLAPSFTPRLASFIPHHGGLQRKYTLLSVITETERLLYAKKPLPAVKRR